MLVKVVVLMLALFTVGCGSDEPAQEVPETVEVLYDFEEEVQTMVESEGIPRAMEERREMLLRSRWKRFWESVPDSLSLPYLEEVGIRGSRNNAIDSWETLVFTTPNKNRQFHVQNLYPTYSVDFTGDWYTDEVFRITGYDCAENQVTTVSFQGILVEAQRYEEERRELEGFCEQIEKALQ